MARPGVTYHAVAQAAQQLLNQAKNPTIGQIRLILGTGSSTTLANHLKTWKIRQKGEYLLSNKEIIPQELLSSVKQLWQKLVLEAELKVQAHENRVQATINELQQSLHKYKTNNQRWQKLFNQWQQEQKEWMIKENKAKAIIVELTHKITTQQKQLEASAQFSELSRLQEQNRLLIEEKLTLLQEKNQLEMQLKQMQPLFKKQAIES